MTPPAQRITSVLIYENIEAAHDFLVKAFGFSPGELHRNDDGTVIHGEVSLDSETVWLHRVAPSFNLRAVPELGSATSMLNILVPDIDEHHSRAVAAGARIISPPADQPYGQREYSAADVEGRPWSFATPT